MDFYLILGLGREASLNEVKRAYRRLARKYHPDINPGDRLAAAQFRQIAEAYETLSDPDRRQRYDTTERRQRAPEPPTFGFEGFDFSAVVSGAAAPTFGDLFADVFHQREAAREAARPEQGADLHQTIAFTFEASMEGGARDVTVTRQERCAACEGTGRRQMPEVRCRHCLGTGIVKSVRGYMVFSKPCGPCRGTGQQAEMLCPECAGEQVRMRTERLTINVPPGLSDGSQIRVPGKGHAARSSAEPGDLYITVRVDPHPVFRREGDDLYVIVPVAVHEAALGARVEVPCIDGRARLRIPPGTQSGQRFHIRERGAPSPRGGRRGDLVVEVRLVLPKTLDERSKELLLEFGRINSEDVRKDLIGT